MSEVMFQGGGNYNRIIIIIVVCDDCDGLALGLIGIIAKRT